MGAFHGVFLICVGGRYPAAIFHRGSCDFEPDPPGKEAVFAPVLRFSGSDDP